ncbi:hypothetical protein V5O48_006581 [Marasmius crinis-equi]|uniref:F-box domain-containing protein n=1 Tax=Marasmius crinis-equi TaxID=585013 RepID=A0ABR3FJ44_9AGAR
MNTNALRQDENPSGHERREVLGALEEEERLLAIYNEELHRQRQIIKDIQTQRKALARSVATRRSYLSAVRKFPAEILEEIFSLVCLSDTYTFGVFTEDKSTMVRKHPVNLSHVCPRWRRVATGCPRLWCSFFLDIVRPRSSFETLVPLYLTNSADRPLTIWFRDTWVGLHQTLELEARWSGDTGRTF